ncbi:SOUL family heme-binding protein [Natronobiforma cellulositropha]|uniref:SOUL family heme-binding protein n=1 Tax=Natronobiforma cellulositropha TaxID=1679076 RepID=UPI0021D5B576|nr:heme-binding protein [Natronobiforma cellulositropha]
MVRLRLTPTRALGTLAGLTAAWIGWGLYTRTTTPTIDYTTLRTADGVEIRRYPALVVAETTADEPEAAFERLYAYLTGANERNRDLPMTAPVRVHRERLELPMTGPVRTTDAEDEVTMAFYLPARLSPEHTPEPTDDRIDLVVEAPRTVAAYGFSWYGTPDRTDRAEAHLRSALETVGVDPTGDPYLLRYSDPFTPPFLQRNEVVVDLE